MTEPELYTAEWFAQQEREAAERFPDHPAECMWHPRPNFVAVRIFFRRYSICASDRFNMACYRGEIVCPSCFVLAHEQATGMTCSWELVPSTPFRWISDEGRPTPFLRPLTEVTE